MFKEIIEKLFFLTDGWPGAGGDGKKKKKEKRGWREASKGGTTKLVLSARCEAQPRSSNPSSAQWAWLHIWSTVWGLTRLAKLHLPVRKRYAFGQGDASARDVRGKSAFDVSHNSKAYANLIPSRHLRQATEGPDLHCAKRLLRRRHATPFTFICGHKSQLRTRPINEMPQNFPSAPRRKQLFFF